MTGFSQLPLAQEVGHQSGRRVFEGVPRILGPRWARLPTVTIGLLALQIFGSAPTAYAPPYLLSLGLSKSSMAVVFVAGPLSGLIMQPLIGVMADNCTSRFGRRRPYMMLGSIICVFAMLLLGFTRAIASLFTGWNNGSNDTLTIWLAILAIYLLDFATNAVQAMDRVLLVDTLPSSDQALGNAWAAGMMGVGSVVGFFVGNVNLPRLLPFLGTSQLQVLSVIVSILLVVGHLVMAALVKERVLLKPPFMDGNVRSKNGFVKEMKDIWRNLWTLPRVIRQICIIQFFSWIAWFPVLCYSTIYVGELYKLASPPPSSPQDQATLDAEATRLGSRALFYASLLALGTNLVLPSFVAEAGALAMLWAVSHLVFAGCMFATFFTHTVLGSTLIVTVTGFSWGVTLWAPFSLLAEAILAEPASMDDGEDGIQLADTRTRSVHLGRADGDSEREAFLRGDGSDHSDEEGDEEEEAMVEERRRVLSNSGAQLSRFDLRNSGVEEIGHGDEEEYEIIDGRGVTRRGREREPSPAGGTLSSKAGIILGIHNIFIVIPQFLVTGFSAILFALLDPKEGVVQGQHASSTTSVPGNGTALLIGSIGNVTQVLERRVEALVSRDEVADGHSNSVVYIFRIGGVAALFAFMLCWRLARELQH